MCSSQVTVLFETFCHFCILGVAKVPICNDWNMI